MDTITIAPAAQHIPMVEDKIALKDLLSRAISEMDADLFTQFVKSLLLSKKLSVSDKIEIIRGAGELVQLIEKSERYRTDSAVMPFAPIYWNLLTSYTTTIDGLLYQATNDEERGLLIEQLIEGLGSAICCGTDIYRFYFFQALANQPWDQQSPDVQKMLIDRLNHFYSQKKEEFFHKWAQGDATEAVIYLGAFRMVLKKAPPSVAEGKLDEFVSDMRKELAFLENAGMKKEWIRRAFEGARHAFPFPAPTDDLQNPTVVHLVLQVEGVFQEMADLLFPELKPCIAA
jgi:hypothetical protein